MIAALSVIRVNLPPSVIASIADRAKATDSDLIARKMPGLSIPYFQETS